MRASTDPRFRGDLKTATVKHLPMTITYDTDDGRRVVRTIEPYGDVIKTQSGNELIKAMDRESGQPRSWRMDRVVSYTLHRGGRASLSRPVPSAPPVRGATPLAVTDDALADGWGAWLEATYDPDQPPYDTLAERDL